MADIFVSFTKSDQQWAHWIAQETTALHHEPHVHDWEIGPGEDIVGWMEKRHDQADYVLCVVSPDYLDEDKAPFSTWERRAALWRMVKGQKGHVLLFVVKPVRLPSLIDHFRHCDLVGLKEKEARRRIAEFLRSPAPPEKVEVPGEDGVAVSNVPIAVPEHSSVARTRWRRSMRRSIAERDGSRLRRYMGSAASGRRRLRRLMRSAIAANIARHGGCGRKRRIRCAPISSRSASGSAGSRRQERGAGVRKGHGAAAARGRGAPHHLRQRDPGRRAQAVPAQGRRSARARHLQRARLAGHRRADRIEAVARDIGADYLIARTGRAAKRAEAEALSEALGGLPLAHEQAAAYCERLSVSFAEYARRLAATPIKLLDAEKDAPLDYHDKLTVAKTFALAIDEAAKLHPAAEALIFYAALLAPEPIPLFLFSEAREKFGEPLASDLAGDGLDEAVAALRAFALVDREPIPDERDPLVPTETIRLHRLVRAVATDRFEGEVVRGGRRVLIEAMAAVYPRAVYNDPNAWPRARRLDALALDLLAGPNQPPTDMEEGAAYLLDRLAAYRQGALAAYAAARFRSSSARSRSARKRSAPSIPRPPTNLNNPPSCLMPRATSTARGHCSNGRSRLTRWRSARSIPTPRKASTTSPACFRPRATSAARDGSSSGRSRSARRRSARASLDCDQPRQPCRRARGPGRPRPRAAALQARAGDPREGAGPEHPATARSLNSLAALLKTQGDYQGARPLFERALAINEKALGPKHPSTATSLNTSPPPALKPRATSPARGRSSSGRWRSTKKCTALSILTLRRTSTILAGLLYAQGDLGGARVLYERALAIHEKALGPKHPETVTSRGNLAVLRSPWKPSRGSVAH